MATTMGLQSWAKQLEPPSRLKSDLDYVKEHPVLKYIRNKIAHYLHDYSRH